MDKWYLTRKGLEKVFMLSSTTIYNYLKKNKSSIKSYSSNSVIMTGKGKNIIRKVVYYNYKDFNKIIPKRLKCPLINKRNKWSYIMLPESDFEILKNTNDIKIRKAIYDFYIAKRDFDTAKKAYFDIFI